MERAALLHDIGYLPAIGDYLREYTHHSPTGWHPIDGAQFLRARGEGRLASLIEGHGNSLEVAQLKQLPLNTISRDLAADIITFCDCQTDPSGNRVSYESRLEEIRIRKGPDSLAFRAHEQASERIRSIISRIEALLIGTEFPEAF